MQVNIPPYSISIWQPPLSPTGEGMWIEPVQASTQHYTLYAANLIHQDTRSVMKVVRFGLNIACYPDGPRGGAGGKADCPAARPSMRAEAAIWG